VPVAYSLLDALSERLMPRRAQEHAPA